MIIMLPFHQSGQMYQVGMDPKRDGENGTVKAQVEHISTCAWGPTQLLPGCMQIWQAVETTQEVKCSRAFEQCSQNVRHLTNRSSLNCFVRVVVKN